MDKHKFDLVMDYIDENINRDNNAIKAGIYEMIGMSGNTFENYFHVLTNNKLGAYIRSRRLYFAAKDLEETPQKSICNIALDCGYSDQSAFTRAFTAEFDMSPGELRKPNTLVFYTNNKYRLEDFDACAKDSTVRNILRQFERIGIIGDPGLSILESIKRGHEEFGFSIDTCYAIADLAERLGISVDAMMQGCFDVVAEVKSASDRIPDDMYAVMDLGIRSMEDLYKICAHYACTYDELNSFMVKAYYRSKDK